LQLATQKTSVNRLSMHKEIHRRLSANIYDDNNNDDNIIIMKFDNTESDYRHFS